MTTSLDKAIPTQHLRFLHSEIGLIHIVYELHLRGSTIGGSLGIADCRQPENVGDPPQKKPRFVQPIL